MFRFIELNTDNPLHLCFSYKILLLKGIEKSKLPTLKEHILFLLKKPYKHYYFLEYNNTLFGCIYVHFDKNELSFYREPCNNIRMFRKYSKFKKITTLNVLILFLVGKMSGESYFYCKCSLKNTLAVKLHSSFGLAFECDKNFHFLQNKNSGLLHSHYYFEPKFSKLI